MKKYLVLWGMSTFSYDDDEITENIGIAGKANDIMEARKMMKDDALDFIHNEAVNRADQTDEDYNPLPEEVCKKIRADWIDAHITVDEQEDEITIDAYDSSYLARYCIKIINLDG